MASQNPDSDITVAAEASNPDVNTLVVTLKDGPKAFEGKYDEKVNQTDFREYDFGAHLVLDLVGPFSYYVLD